MAIEKFKDVKIGDREFRVGLLTAMTGDWIVTQIGVGKYNDDVTYRKVQQQLLGVCSYLRPSEGVSVPMKVFENGRFLIPELELEYDLELFSALCKEALDFNVGPFFKKRMAEVSNLPSALTTNRSDSPQA